MRGFFEVMQTKNSRLCVVCKMRKRDRRSRPERQTNWGENYILVFLYNTTFFENCHKNAFVKCDNNAKKRNKKTRNIFNTATKAAEARPCELKFDRKCWNPKKFFAYSLTQLLLIKSISSCAHKPTSHFRISLVTRGYDCVDESAC